MKKSLSTIAEMIVKYGKPVDMGEVNGVRLTYADGNIFATPKLGKPKPERKAKKQASPPIDKLDIISRRGYTCDCDCGQQGHDLHHAFIGRHKGVAILDDERNLVLVNHAEHIARTFDNLFYRKWFWGIQVARYGKKSMMEWVALIPEKMKSRIDWL